MTYIRPNKIFLYKTPLDLNAFKYLLNEIFNKEGPKFSTLNLGNHLLKTKIEKLAQKAENEILSSSLSQIEISGEMGRPFPYEIFLGLKEGISKKDIAVFFKKIGDKFGDTPTESAEIELEFPSADSMSIISLELLFIIKENNEDNILIVHSPSSTKTISRYFIGKIIDPLFGKNKLFYAPTINLKKIKDIATFVKNSREDLKKENIEFGKTGITLSLAKSVSDYKKGSKIITDKRWSGLEDIESLLTHYEKDYSDLIPILRGLDISLIELIKNEGELEGTFQFGIYFNISPDSKSWRISWGTISLRENLILPFLFRIIELMDGD